MPDDSLAGDDQQTREDLKNLLRFTEQMLATREKTTFDIAEYPIRLTERDLTDPAGEPLPGIGFGPSEDVWLSFVRMRERPPPKPPAELEPWLRSEARPTPAKPPSLLSERVVFVAADEATDLIEAAFAHEDEVGQMATNPGEPERWSVPVRPAELPSVVETLHRYIAGPWRAWADEEAPRRKAIELYSALYKAHAQIAAAGGEGGLELVVGIGLARWQHVGRRINLPLIEQRAEFELDETSGNLSILARGVPPTPALRAFLDLGIAGAAELQREMTARLDSISKDPDLAFGPFQPASFLGVLETCAARLDASGTVLPANEDLGPAGEALRIGRGFCIIVRARREDILRDDIRRQIDALSTEGKELPETARRFVLPPPDVAPDDVGPIDLSGLDAIAGRSVVGAWAAASGGAGDGSAPKAKDWLFFPLPANEEQEEIARRLQEPDVFGVVVQGPPGTGKTHTIANIIGHAMATGQRVLVSAHTAEALSAIRDKLPPALRDLTIAVTHSDREGARQLEEAVSALAERAQSINPREVKQRAEDLLRLIRREDGRVAEIDLELEQIARANLARVLLRGTEALPQDIAAWVAQQGDQHAWFPDDLDLASDHAPRFGEAEISEARSLRLRLGGDIAYGADHVPSGSDALPALGALVAAHRTLREAAERRLRERDGSLPRPDLTAASAGEPAALLAWLERLAAWDASIGTYEWMREAWGALAGERNQQRFSADALRPMFDEAARLAQRGEALALHALELPEIPEADRLGEALANLAAGRPAFGFFKGFGRNPVKDAVQASRIAAEPPRDAAAWAKLADLHAWRREVRGFVARWNALAAQHNLTGLPQEATASRDALGQLGRRLTEMLALAADARARSSRLQALFPYGLDIDAVIVRIDISVAVSALRANLGDVDLLEAESLRDRLREDGIRIGGQLGEALQQVADGLGANDLPDAEAAEIWRGVQREADRVGKLRAELQRLDALADLVRASGAANWAEQIRRKTPSEADETLPVDWQDAWDHACAKGFLARVANRERVQALTAARAELVASRERRFLDAIELMTYLGLRSRLTENVQAALRKFLSALTRLPKTSGAKTAGRQRRILRDSLQQAVKAIPCWIMPEWRVAEQLPPDLGSFDLVIIDEASQSNISALPVVLRGKKLLIVGDDRQVSPVSVGVEEAVVNRLRTTYLAGQPLAEQIDPATSLYELGGMMYPGKVIVLREHFRCVEPIIRFSSRFYGGHLVPLRLPKPSERLDPPLIDVLVEDGQRRGDVNDAEATYIVEEIKRAIADPILNAAGKRSMGVISLHADKQAKLIYDRLIHAVGPEVMSDHHIMCGDAATFQGQERDIIFLSMVHDGDTASKQSSRLYEQRYNVALSRARDRMVLVRSVTPSMLKEGDIKLEVLRHFQDPMAGGRIGQSDDVLEACESKFERDVGQRLLQAGYRIRAQVPAGGYRIDFVVEGENDRRLAIELDGDSFHGPERWAHDVKRQKALERVGWTFWRCWASEWECAKDAVFSDLVTALEARGISPIGTPTAGDALPVEFRTVRHRPKLEEAVKPASLADAPETLFESTSELTPAMSEDAADVRVSAGDSVSIRYGDGKARALRLHIVADGTANGRDRIAPTSPLGAAIMGLRAEDETEVVIDGRTRIVVVESIDRAA
jgi:very-short-patch-repair endonuclease